MKKKLLHILFIGIILLILLAGLLKTVFFPHDLNTYENRYAEKLSPFSIASFLDGSFQGSMDSALSDQVHFAQYCKKIYNTAHSLLQEKLLLPLAQLAPDRYVNYQSLRIFGGTHLTYWTNNLSVQAEQLSATVNNYNTLFSAHPEVEFYLYYIENDTDINFESGTKAQVFESLRDGLTLPEANMDHFSIPDFETYRQYFYRTDHHWNHAGSYAGYLELLSLLGSTGPALEPVKTTAIGNFSGSKANEAGLDTFSEPFVAHQFAFPAMVITVNGQPAADYGSQDAFFSGSAAGLSYGSFYGGDFGEIIFNTGTTDRGNLLIIGESYDNAVLKLVASHYDCTYSIDLRNYTHYMGHDFQLSSYLTDHNINQVLLIGSNGFYTSDAFRLEG